MKQHDVKNQEKLIEYVKCLNADSNTARLDDALAAEDPLAAELQKLGGYVAEVRDFFDHLADGIFDSRISRDNPFRGACLQHESNLRHLMWQVERMAAGDYSQHVDFMGEFSDSFNLLITQLEERRRLAEENSRIQRQLDQRRMKEMEKELRQQSEHYKQLLEIQNQQRGFRHDIKNHIISLSGLLKEGKTEEAEKYIRTAAAPFIEKEGDRLALSNNIVLDTLVSQKISTAKRFGIAFDACIHLPRPLLITSEEICVLLGNALDNAIEAASIAEQDGEICLQLLEKDTMVIVLVKNTAPAEPNNQNGNLVTTKSDSENHGFGLKNIQRVVDSYNGVMTKNWDEGIFTLSILLMDACLGEHDFRLNASGRE